MDTEGAILRIAAEAQEALNSLYAQDQVVEGSALDQAGLRDGLQIVEEFIRYGELGVAFDHLRYMISEADLQLSSESLADLSKIEREFGRGRR
jgi:hypothetical protein